MLLWGNDLSVLGAGAHAENMYGYCFLPTTILALVIYLFFYRNPGPLDAYFVFEWLAYSGFLGMGALCLVLRGLEWLLCFRIPWTFSGPENRGYLCVGVLNVWLGLLALVLFGLSRANVYVIKLMLPNLTVGALMLIDILCRTLRTA